MAFILCSCFLFICIAKDITNDLPLLDCKKPSKSDDRKMKQRFCDTIQMYSDAKQLSKTFGRERGIDSKFDYYLIGSLTNLMQSISIS